MLSNMFFTPTSTMQGGSSIFKIIFSLSILVLVWGDLKVTQVQVLFRHGERTPRRVELYPNDIHGISEYEPWGLAQLTNVGKMREYRIGKMLKRRYRGLLGSHYVPSSVYAVTTGYDRTQTSLQLVLAGLFPPSKAETWNSELPWIPIPIHYAPPDVDNVMKAYRCPEFQNALVQVSQLPEVRQKIAAHKDLFEFLSLKTGLDLTEPVPVYELYNLMVVQKSMNLTIPVWCTDAVFQEMSEVTVLVYELWTYTNLMKRLNGGPEIRKFIENMHLGRAQENPRKMYLYSGHESTLSAFLRAHGILEPKIPLYGSAVMFEKLRSTEGRHFVKMVMWTGVTEQLITLRVPGCEEVCPVERYLQLTRDVVPTDDDLDCHWRRLNINKLRHVYDDVISEN